METKFKIYMAGWGAALLAGTVVFVVKRQTLLPTCPGYFKFLAMPWKVVTFVIAATGMTVIARTPAIPLGISLMPCSCRCSPM